MTLNEIIVSALQQLKRGRDSQTIDNYRGTFTQYANMAQQDLSKAFPQYRSDTVLLTDGVFHISALPRWCTKLINIQQNGKNVDFKMAVETGMIAVNASGEVAVRYRYLPLNMENATDSPDLPKQLHQCIVSYVVGCDRSGGDASTQGGASIYFQLYNEQKRDLLRGNMGVPETYRLHGQRY